MKYLIFLFFFFFKKKKVSSLCFFKDVNINRSEGYSNFIVKEDYDENIKVLIKNNDIMINIYLCIYESNKDLCKYKIEIY